jgi:hypothetical protein
VKVIPGGPGIPPGGQDAHRFKAILSRPRWR